MYQTTLDEALIISKYEKFSQLSALYGSTEDCVHNVTHTENPDEICTECMTTLTRLRSKIRKRWVAGEIVTMPDRILTLKDAQRMAGEK